MYENQTKIRKAGGGNLFQSNLGAFTLAEVLITLGIIGVVAAMTIPNLIANINGLRFRNQFKKTISTLNQAVRMSQAQYGFNFAEMVEVKGNDCASQNPEEVQTICSLLNGTLTGVTYYGEVSKSSHLKNVYTNTDSLATSSIDDLYAWGLSDGSILFASLDSKCTLEGNPPVMPNLGYYGCWAYIDVNGITKPNKEVRCTVGRTTSADEEPDNCIVKNDANHLTDIYPIIFFDSSVVPGSNAALYVLKTAK